MSLEGDSVTDNGEGAGSGEAGGIDTGGVVEEGGAGEAELALYIENGEVLVSGPTEATLAYVEKLRDAGANVSTEVLTGRRAADLAAVLTTVGAVAQSDSGIYMRVAEESVPHLIQEGLMPTKDGVHTFLAMTRSGPHISHHVRFNGMTANPAQMLSIQTVAVQFALRMAIAEVTESIKRVEGKVDALLKLANAEKVGSVLGLHQSLSYYCELLDESGVVTTSDWNAIASTGAQLSMAINRLRKYISMSVAEVVVSAPINQRADAVDKLMSSSKVAQSLSLLVVVEDAMFKFQRLRVAHVHRTEPEFLEATVISARQVLEDNARIDEELYISTHATLNAAAGVRPLEIHRALSAGKLSKATAQMKEHLDEFSRARQLQTAEWNEPDHPNIGDAANEVGRRIQATGKMIDSAGNQVVDKGFASLGSIGRALQNVANNHVEANSDAEAAGTGEATEEREAIAERPEK